MNLSDLPPCIIKNKILIYLSRIETSYLSRTCKALRRYSPPLTGIHVEYRILKLQLMHMKKKYNKLLTDYARQYVFECDFCANFVYEEDDAVFQCSNCGNAYCYKCSKDYYYCFNCNVSDYPRNSVKEDAYVGMCIVCRYVVRVNEIAFKEKKIIICKDCL